MFISVNRLIFIKDKKVGNWSNKTYLQIILDVFKSCSLIFSLLIVLGLHLDSSKFIIAITFDVGRIVDISIISIYYEKEKKSGSALLLKHLIILDTFEC